LRASLGWQSKSKSFNESEMALFFECMPSCARKVLDTADIVRDGDVSTTIIPKYGLHRMDNGSPVALS
jgi:hypothetical protein